MIGLFNVDVFLAKNLKNFFDLVDASVKFEDKIDGLLIDWIPTKSRNPNLASLLLRQTYLVEKYKKKIPILIFDRYLSISKKEATWLRRNNIILFEPALNHREEFKYLPFSTRIKEIENIKINEEERNLDLIYKGNIGDKLKTFEKYYVSYGRIYPSNKIVYNDSIDKIKEEEYSNSNVIKENIDFSRAKATVALGSKRDYRIGYLDPVIFEALNKNCMVFMPYEHRYFRGLCENAWFKSVDYWTERYESIYVGVISDIYDNIKDLYPEFNIKYTIDMIKYNLA